MRWLWKWVWLRWPSVRESDGEKDKLTLWSFKYRCQLIIRLKAIKSIGKLLCFLSSYISLPFFNLCSLRSIGIMMIGAFGLMVDCSIGLDWSSLLSLLIWLSSVWLILKAIYFTYELHAWVFGVAFKTCYRSHKSDFHKFDLSSGQFTSLINCMLFSTIHLSPNAVMTIGLSSHKSRFICHFRIATLSKSIIL